MKEQKGGTKKSQPVNPEDTSVSYNELLTKRLEGGAAWVKDPVHGGWILDGTGFNVDSPNSTGNKADFQLHQESLSRQINRLRPDAEIDDSEPIPEALNFFTDDDAEEFDNDIYKANSDPHWRTAYKSLHLLKKKENRPKNRLAAHTLPAKFLVPAKYQLVEAE